MAAKKKPRPALRLFVLGALLVPGLALAYGWGLGGWFGDDRQQASGGALVRRGPLAITITERGNLEAKNKYSLKNEVEGRTTILYLIEEGTRVEKGDLVAELDATSLVDRRVVQQDKVLNARATHTKAVANLEIQKTENESLIARAEQAVTFAETDLAKYVDGDWPRQLQEADESIILAEEELKSAENQYDWSKKLEESGFLTRTELERDELAHNRAKILLDQRRRAKELLIEYEHPRQLAELKGDLDEARRELKKVGLQADAQLVDQETAVQTSEARLRLEEKELTKLEDQIQKAVIRAPVAGMVVYAREEGGRMGGGEPVQEGGEVRERQEVVSIPSSRDMIAQASIHESVLKQVQTGQEVRVRVDAIPAREFRGRVDFVAMLPDKNSWWSNPNLRLYKTEISLTDETDQMRPGMSCNVEILVDEIADTLYVPLQAVVHHGGRNIAFVRGSQGIEERVVEVGPHNEKWVAIESGLAEGEVVLLSPPPGFLPQDGGREEDRSLPEMPAIGPPGGGRELSSDTLGSMEREAGSLLDGGGTLEGGGPGRPDGEASGLQEREGRPAGPGPGLEHGRSFSPGGGDAFPREGGRGRQGRNRPGTDAAAGQGDRP